MSSSSRLKRLVSLVFAMRRSMFKQVVGDRALDMASLPRLAVLRYVHERGEPLMKEVAGFLCVTPPSATAMIGGLVEAGLLERRADPRDRRNVRLRVTPKGERFMRRSFKGVEAHMAKTFQRLSPAEQDQLISLFEKLLV